MNKFCPKCGNETEKIYNALCGTCYAQSMKLIIAPKTVKTNLCSCGRFQTEKKWTKARNMDALIETILRKNIKLMDRTNLNVKYLEKKIIGKTVLPVFLEATLEFNNRQVIEKETVDVVITPKSCEFCSRKYGSYYEAIIQIRTGKNPGSIREFIENKIKLYAKKDDLSFINKTDDIKDGATLYIGSKKAAEKAAKEAKDLYNLEMKTSSKIAGMKNGRTIYRTTILLKG